MSEPSSDAVKAVAVVLANQVWCETLGESGKVTWVGEDPHMLAERAIAALTELGWTDGLDLRVEVERLEREAFDAARHFAELAKAEDAAALLREALADRDQALHGRRAEHLRAEKAARTGSEACKRWLDAEYALTKARTSIDRQRERITDLSFQLAAARRQVDVMRPVVEAAELLEQGFRDRRPGGGSDGLMSIRDTVTKYEQEKAASLDGS